MCRPYRALKALSIFVMTEYGSRPSLGIVYYFRFLKIRKTLGGICNSTLLSLPICNWRKRWDSPLGVVYSSSALKLTKTLGVCNDIHLLWRISKQENWPRVVDTLRWKKSKTWKQQQLENLIRDLLDTDIVLQTHESTTCSKFEDFIDIHVKEISGNKAGKFNLNWAHTAISKSKVIWQNTEWSKKKG